MHHTLVHTKKNLKFIFILLSIYLFSCNRILKEKDENYQTEYVNKTNLNHSESIAIINSFKDSLSSNEIDLKDSLSLKLFWCDFQNNLRNNYKQKVIKDLEYPIHAIFPVIFKYACDCDTLEFIKGQEKYEDFDITKNNVIEYYDFIFNDTLKDIILQTSFEDLLYKGIWNSHKIEGLTYNIFPKNYNIKVKCSNDHLIKLYINFKNNKWIIGFGGL